MNKRKLHLNENGSRILGDIYHKEISKIFHWTLAENNSGFEEFNCNYSLTGKKQRIVKQSYKLYGKIMII